MATVAMPVRTGSTFECPDCRTSYGSAEGAKACCAELVDSYECYSCGELHLERSDAVRCCANEPDRVWLCGGCGSRCETETDAYACCANVGEERAFRCSECGELHNELTDMEACCDKHREAIETPMWRCAQCYDRYDSKAAAMTCCL